MLCEVFIPENQTQIWPSLESVLQLTGCMVDKLNKSKGMQDLLVKSSPWTPEEMAWSLFVLLFVFCFVFEIVSCILSCWAWTYYGAQDDFELLIFSPSLLVCCWDYRHASSHSVYVSWGSNPGLLCMLCTHVLAELHPSHITCLGFVAVLFCFSLYKHSPTISPDFSHK